MSFGETKLNSTKKNVKVLLTNIFGMLPNPNILVMNFNDGTK